MSVRLYMDVHVDKAITDGLLRRGVDVLTAQADGAGRFRDPELLDRSTALGRVLFSQDKDLLKEATHRQANGIAFAGVVYASQLGITISEAISSLELIAKAGTPEEFNGRVEFLPWR